MPRDLILGTAGHIDHGKTSLIKALTGIDCDRLPEEKARGITIDIGFARLDLGKFHLGVVDVPGHERFIRNMLAGATGIDLVLLVVAADDSVMPQTREHLDILKLLGIKHGVIALTKCDTVDAETREVVALEVRDLVAGSFLADAPIIATSASTGLGLDELRAALIAACNQLDASTAHDEFATPSGQPFRLAIDRSFIVQGHGTVITGSVTSGSARVGDELEWQPLGRRVRVRSLQNHDQPVEEVRRGMRAAINLAGVDHADVVRGQELASPGYLVPTRTLTVRLRASADVRRPLKHRTEVRLHIGTAEVMATLALLDGPSLPPGGEQFAQLFLDEPVVATWNQPFVIRESSAAATLGGGRVLQPIARKIRRQDAGALQRLELLGELHPSLDRAEAVAWQRGLHGFDALDVVREAGGDGNLIEQLQSAGRLVPVSVGTRSVFVHVNAMHELEERVLTALSRLHAEAPLLTHHDRSKLVASLDYAGEPAFVNSAIDRLVARRAVRGDAHRVARADFKPKLSANQLKLKDMIVAAHAAAAFQPPDPDSFAPQAGGHAKQLREIYEVAVAEGSLVKVAESIYLHAQADTTMKKKVTDRLAGGSPGLTVAEIRDLLGTTRKFAVPLCEYLDRIGVTRRNGDLRVAAQDFSTGGE